MQLPRQTMETLKEINKCRPTFRLASAILSSVLSTGDTVVIIYFSNVENCSKSFSPNTVYALLATCRSPKPLTACQLLWPDCVLFCALIFGCAEKRKSILQFKFVRRPNGGAARTWLLNNLFTYTPVTQSAIQYAKRRQIFARIDWLLFIAD